LTEAWGLCTEFHLIFLWLVRTPTCQSFLIDCEFSLFFLLSFEFFVKSDGKGCINWLARQEACWENETDVMRQSLLGCRLPESDCS
jgi:hypothetical protein